MKILTSEKSPSGKERFVFHIGREEAKLMVGLIVSASAYTPRTFEMQPTHARLNDMRRELHRVLNEPIIAQSYHHEPLTTEVTKEQFQKFLSSQETLKKEL